MKKEISFNIFVYLMVSIFLVFVADKSLAATYCVSDEATLIAALNDAKDNGSNDVIKIQQGIYSGGFEYQSTEPFNLNIEGGYHPGCTARDLDTENNSVLRGGGIVLKLSAPSVLADFVVDRITLQNGSQAGISIENLGTVTLTNSIIQDNGDSLGGTATVQIENSDTVILGNNVIRHNDSGKYTTPSVGGVYIKNAGAVSLANNFIIGNDSYYTYAGAFINADTATLINNTIANNRGMVCSGVFLELNSDSSVASIFNNIIYGNSQDLIDSNRDLWIENDVDDNGIASTVHLYNNNFDQSSEGIYIEIPFPIDPSNIDNEDPLFVDPLDMLDYHLQAGSPCMDAGTAAAPLLPGFDFDGDPRILGVAPDMGADEIVQILKSEAEDTGNIFNGETRIINKSTASGGKAVGYIGNSPGNWLEFEDVYVGNAGEYILTVQYLSGESRTIFISTNGESPITQECNSGSWSVVDTFQKKINLNFGNNNIRFYNDNSWGPDIDKIEISSIGETVTLLSALNWTYETSGWSGHPTQKNLSVEGNTLNLNGTIFDNGIGTHASSEIRYNLSGNYTRFSAEIGVDYEVDQNPNGDGSVIFQVWTDGDKIYESNVMNVYTPYESIKLDMTGVNELTLIVTDAEDGKTCDHANWANAKLVNAHIGENVTLLSALNWAYETSGWSGHPTQKNLSVEGNTLNLNGTIFDNGIGTHASSEIRYNLSGNYTRFSAEIGVDYEVDQNPNGDGSVIFQVWTDGDKIYESNVMNVYTPYESIKLDMTGVNELTLIVTDAEDGKTCDHANWANAKLANAY